MFRAKWQAYFQAKVFRIKAFFKRGVVAWTESLAKRVLGKDVADFVDEHQTFDCHEYRSVLEEISQKPVIVFCFRTLHFIDWFIPIHKAISRNYQDVCVVYVDYSRSLLKIGSGFDSVRYQGQIKKRLVKYGVSPYRHFSDRQFSRLKSEVNLRVCVSSERIRQENLNVGQRVYLPHYSVSKASDICLPPGLGCQHILLPCRKDYFYRSLVLGDFPGGVRQHPVGYPKLFLKDRSPTKKAASRLPPDAPLRVLYAPTLDVEILLKHIGDGLIEALGHLTDAEVLIKLHPSLVSNGHYVGNLLRAITQVYPHIRHDEGSGSLAETFEEADLMVTDYGSAGAEWKLSTGKPLVFVRVPAKYEGGGDLLFRDRFADQICSPRELESVLPRIRRLVPLGESELKALQARVLGVVGDRGDKAAAVLHELAKPFPI